MLPGILRTAGIKIVTHRERYGNVLGVKDPQIIADCGIERGSVVGMHLPRCADAIAAMLAIMASGCVYLPLDPSYPQARLRFMLDQAEAVAVLSDADISGGGDVDLSGPRRVCIELPGPLAATAPRDIPAVNAALAEPRRLSGNHSTQARVRHGTRPAWAPPKISRDHQRPENVAAPAVQKVQSDQTSPKIGSQARMPSRFLPSREMD